MEVMGIQREIMEGRRRGARVTAEIGVVPLCRKTDPCNPGEGGSTGQITTSGGSEGRRSPAQAGGERRERKRRREWGPHLGGVVQGGGIPVHGLWGLKRDGGASRGVVNGSRAGEAETWPSWEEE